MSSVQNRGPALWNLDFILFSVIEIDHNDFDKCLFGLLSPKHSASVALPSASNWKTFRFEN